MKYLLLSTHVPYLHCYESKFTQITTNENMNKRSFLDINLFIKTIFYIIIT